MRQFRRLLYPLHLFWGILFSIAMTHPASATDILIITNQSSNVEKLSRNEIRQVFLGGTLSRKYEPVNLMVGDPVRTLFNTKILGLTEGRIQAYWAQLLFSGKNEQPPKEFNSTAEMMTYIMSNHNAIGYISTKTPVPTNVKIIFQK